jgi:two-component system sensor histidine kinase DegS
MDVGETLIKVTVDDDGKGFDVEQLDGKGGMGLKVISDRVEMMGGLIETESVVGQGTRVTFELPVQERVSKT